MFVYRFQEKFEMSIILAVNNSARISIFCHWNLIWVYMMYSQVSTPISVYDSTIYFIHQTPRATNLNQCLDLKIIHEHGEITKFRELIRRLPEITVYLNLILKILYYYYNGSFWQCALIIFGIPNKYYLQVLWRVDTEKLFDREVVK